MSWFDDAAGIAMWGGSKFRYPATRDTFHQDCRWHDMASFALHDTTGLMLGFGQFYRRSGRIHLARIVVRPGQRGRGTGRVLVQALLDEGRRRFELPEFSLFVRKDNPAAYKLYCSMGFIKNEFPAGAPMQDICYYMTR